MDVCSGPEQCKCKRIEYLIKHQDGLETPIPRFLPHIN